MNGKALTRRQAMCGATVAVAAPMVLGVTAPLFAAPRQTQATIVFEPHIPSALRRALNFAGPKGFVASMPQLMHARAKASYENIIWNTWFTANSEESVVKTPKGHTVVVAVHGGGIFSNPERFEMSYHASLEHDNGEGLTGQTAAKITSKEARDILEGRLPNGDQISMYSYSDFRNGIDVLPMRYGVVIDFDLARKSKRGYESFDALAEDPNMIIRAGGTEQNVAYLEKFRRRHGTQLMGNWHPYNRIDPDQPQTRVPFLAGNRGGVESEGKNQGLGWGYDAEYGMGGDASMVGMGRYIAVAPKSEFIGVDKLDFVI